MVTMAFLGDLGSGKTTLMTRQAILTKKLHPEKIIYSNYVLNNYQYEELDLMDLYLNHQEVRDTIILIDEIYTMMDSRLSSSHRNEVESYFIAMTRKAKADLFVTMQYETFTDCRLSPFIKVKYVMETVPVEYKATIENVEYCYVKPHPYLFKVHLFDDRNTGNPIYREFIFDGRKWFKEFNTDQYILPPKDVLQRIELKQVETELRLEKTKRKLEELKNGKPKEVKKIKQRV